MALGVFLLIIVAVSRAESVYLKAASYSTPTIKAAYLLEEGIEILKLIRDQNWSNISALSSGVNYYLKETTPANGTWSISTLPVEIIDSTFYRIVTANSVRRDANSDIQLTGTLDPNIMRVSVSVSWWQNGATTTKTVHTYLTNIFGI